MQQCCKYFFSNKKAAFLNAIYRVFVFNILPIIFKGSAKTIAMVQDILNDNKLSVTHPRKTILALFVKRKHALTWAEINKLTGSKLDRITVYRTLQTFLDNGIIHNIPTKDDSILYILTRGKENHAHFICTKCKKAYCLDVELPAIKMPRGYKVSGMDVVVYGICEGCGK